VNSYIVSQPELVEISTKTTEFLNGFYSDFALELLSSIDYIITKNNTFDKQIITQNLAEWSNRKRSIFSKQEYIDFSIDYLQNI
jgi:hypothetical protein